VVWIAESIREEHRAAIDWLNANTIEGFDFFAVEVEALRIGSSPPAPWFNVVAKPNSWSRGIRRATRSTGGGQLDERAKAYIAYWSGFGAFLQDKAAPYKVPTQPRVHWCSFGIGRAGFILSDTAGFRDRKLGVEIYINHRAAKTAFDLLARDRQAIEAEFGGKLDWQRLDDKKACRIAVFRTDMDPNIEVQRPLQYEWLLDQMGGFFRVFRDRIRTLLLDNAAAADLAPALAAAADNDASHCLSSASNVVPSMGGVGDTHPSPGYDRNK
jgi:hypothetical protein